MVLCFAVKSWCHNFLRAKLNSMLNYVDKGQNKGQLRDFPLFSKKTLISMVNGVGLTCPFS